MDRRSEQDWAAYEHGVLDGLRRHTWMRDGVTYVGNGTYTLGQAVAMAVADGTVSALTVELVMGG